VPFPCPCRVCAVSVPCPCRVSVSLSMSLSLSLSLSLTCVLLLLHRPGRSSNRRWQRSGRLGKFSAHAAAATCDTGEDNLHDNDVRRRQHPRRTAVLPAGVRLRGPAAHCVQPPLLAVVDVAIEGDGALGLRCEHQWLELRRVATSSRR